MLSDLAGESRLVCNVLCHPPMQHYVVMTFLLAGTVRADELPVPPDMQAHVLVRTLAFDRALPLRAGASVGLGVVFGTPDQDSMRSQYDLRRAFQRMNGTKLLGRSVAVSVHAYKSVVELERWIQEKAIEAIYIAPGLRGEVGAIRAVCHEHKIASLAAGRAMVERGVAIGVVPNGGDKLRILVNLSAARSAGMDLDGKLLQLAEVLPGGAAARQ